MSFPFALIISTRSKTYAGGSFLCTTCSAALVAIFASCLPFNKPNNPVLVAAVAPAPAPKSFKKALLTLSIPPAEKPILPPSFHQHLYLPYFFSITQTYFSIFRTLSFL
jgi:hypothetical protein